MPKVSRATCDRKPAWPAFAMVGGVKPQGSTAKSRIDLGDSVAESAAQRWAQLAEPPCAEPHARWCGRGRAVRLPPIPIGKPRPQPAKYSLFLRPTPPVPDS